MFLHGLIPQHGILRHINATGLHRLAELRPVPHHQHLISRFRESVAGGFRTTPDGNRIDAGESLPSELRIGFPAVLNAWWRDRTEQSLIGSGIVSSGGEVGNFDPCLTQLHAACVGPVSEELRTGKSSLGRQFRDKNLFRRKDPDELCHGSTHVAGTRPGTRLDRKFLFLIQTFVVNERKPRLGQGDRQLPRPSAIIRDMLRKLIRTGI